MTSSKSFYVDALILGKHRQQLQQEHLQHQRCAIENNQKTSLQLPLLHHSLPPLSHPVFRFYPYVAHGGSEFPEVRRGGGSVPPMAGLPSCFCPFCLPATAAVDPPFHGDQRQTSTCTASRDPSPVTRRRGWQPWLQETPTSETQPQESASIKNEPTYPLHSHQLIVSGGIIWL